MKLSSFIFILSFIIIGIVFYILDNYNTFINDDLFYAFIYKTSHRIESISDIFFSQIDHYFFRNGRFLVHFIVQLFCGILGPEMFYVFNTFVFLLFLYVVYCYICSYTKNDAALLLIILLSTFLFIPRWSITIIGNISGTVNYLWCAVSYILFIIMFEKEKKKNRNVFFLKNVVFFVVALMVGSLQESFCVGISAYLLFYYILNPYRFKGTVVPLVLGFLVGSTIVILAPSNFIRFEQQQAQSFFVVRFFSNSLSLMFGSSGLPMLLLLSFIAWLKKRALLYSVLKEHQILVFSIIFNGIFVAFLAYTGDHQLTSIGVFSMILFLILLYKMYGETIRSKVFMIKIAILLFISILSINIYQERKKVSLAYNEMWENARITTDGIVVDVKYDSLYCLNKNWITSNFTRLRNSITLYERYWMSNYLTDGNNSKHCQTILPDYPNTIVNYCTPQYKVSENVYKPTSKNYYILVTQGEPSSNKMIHVVSKSFPKFAIINMIKTGSPNTVQDIPLSSLLDYFTIGKNTYYIYRDFQAVKALSVELKTVGL